MFAVFIDPLTLASPTIREVACDADLVPQADGKLLAGMPCGDDGSDECSAAVVWEYNAAETLIEMWRAGEVGLVVYPFCDGFVYNMGIGR